MGIAFTRRPGRRPWAGTCVDSARRRVWRGGLRPSPRDSPGPLAVPILPGPLGAVTRGLGPSALCSRSAGAAIVSGGGAMCLVEHPEAEATSGSRDPRSLESEVSPERGGSQAGSGPAWMPHPAVQRNAAMPRLRPSASSPLRPGTRTRAAPCGRARHCPRDSSPRPTARGICRLCGAAVRCARRRRVLPLGTEIGGSHLSQPVHPLPQKAGTLQRGPVSLSIPSPQSTDQVGCSAHYCIGAASAALLPQGLVLDDWSKKPARYCVS